MFLRLLEYLFLVLAGTGLLTQLIWPLWTGRALFPLFGKRAAFEAKLAKYREERELEAMAKKWQERRRQARRADNPDPDRGRIRHDFDLPEPPMGG